MADKKEYIERGALIRLFDERYITAIVQQKHDDVPEDHKKHWKGVQSGTNWCRNTVLEAPAADVVSRGVYEQVKWERDMDMQQLEEHGIPFCGVADDVVKVVRCKDCRFYGNEERHPYGGECEWFGALVERNNFCFYGERKEQT